MEHTSRFALRLKEPAGRTSRNGAGTNLSTRVKRVLEARGAIASFRQLHAELSGNSKRTALVEGASVADVLDNVRGFELPASRTEVRRACNAAAAIVVTFFILAFISAL